MRATQIEFLVEERSAEEMLRGVLPRLIGGTSFRVHAYQGKSDLMRKLPSRLCGYRNGWRPDESVMVVVVVDRDDDNCIQLKQRLDQAAKNAGLLTRSVASGRPYQVVNRIVVEELEAWFAGDWEAVRSAYPRVPSRNPFPNPENIRGGTWEALQRVLQRAGYFPGGLRKIEFSRKVARCLDPDCNAAHSFEVFRDVVREMIRP